MYENFIFQVNFIGAGCIPKVSYITNTVVAFYNVKVLVNINKESSVISSIVLPTTILFKGENSNLAFPSLD